MAGLPVLVAAWMTGIALAASLQLPLLAQSLLTLAAIAAACILTYLKKPAVVALLFLFCMLGMLNATAAILRLHVPLQEQIGREITCRGYITDCIPSTDGNTRFLFQVEELLETGGREVKLRTVLRVFAYRVPEDFHSVYGQPLQLTGIVELPAGKRNPGGFDYARYLEASGVSAVMTVKPQNLQIMPGKKGNAVTNFFGIARTRAKEVFFRYLPPAEAGLASAVILGQRPDAQQHTVLAYQQLGLAHLLAVSGLHVGFVTMLLQFLCLRLAGKHRLPAFLLTIALLICYALLTGGKPPVWRAALTFIIAGSAAHLGREKDGLQVLAISALLMLCFRPLWLFGLSFQFSFAATAGILLLTPRLKGYFSRLPALLAGPLAVTLGAQLAVLPLQVEYFGVLSLLTLPLNLLCVPLVGLTCALGLIALVAGLAWLPLSAPLCWAALPPLFLLERLPTAALLPGSVLNVPSLPFGWWVVYLAGLLAMAAGCSLRPFSARKIFALLFAANLLLFSGLPVDRSGTTTVTFLDVGQGMCIHIRTADGHHLLIDGGSDNNASGSAVILPYLRKNRIHKLTAVILTHPHEDHYGGLAAVIENIPVSLFLSSGQQEETAAFASLMQQLENKQIPVGTVFADYRLVMGRTEIDVLSPPQTAFKNTGDDVNNNSLVLRIRCRDFSCLITGDAETAAVDYLLRQKRHVLRADVMQIPHHGSLNAFTAALLDAVDPKIAVIPVGRNRFGHPHQETLEALMAYGLFVWRTDEHGAIIIQNDGKQWSGRSFVMPHAQMVP